MQHPFSSCGWSEFRQTSSQGFEAIQVVHALQWDHYLLIVQLQLWYPLEGPWLRLSIPFVSDHSSRGYGRIFLYVLCFYVSCPYFSLSCPCSSLSCAYFSLSFYHSCSVVFQIGAITHQNNQFKKSRRQSTKQINHSLTNIMQPLKTGSYFPFLL